MFKSNFSKRSANPKMSGILSVAAIYAFDFIGLLTLFLSLKRKVISTHFAERLQVSLGTMPLILV